MIRKEIEIIKEYVISKKFKVIHFTIRTILYDNSIQYLLDLLEIIKQDFPDLDLKIVKAIVYGGDCYKRTRGLEFSLDKTAYIPSGYKRQPILTYSL